MELIPKTRMVTMALGEMMTPWERHQLREIRLRMIREVRRTLATRRLNMVYHGITQIRTFTRIYDQGNVDVRQTFVPPLAGHFVIMKVGP